MKHLLPLAAVALTLAACNAQTPTPATQTQNAASSSAVSLSNFGDAPNPNDMTLEWWAKNTGTDDNGAPHNILTLRTAGNSNIVYQTECAGTTLVAGVPDMDGSTAYIQCWWAGGGDQFALFTVDGKTVIRHRTVDEEAGYGKWEDLKTL